MLVEDAIVTYPNPSGPREPALDGGVAVYAASDGRLLWDVETLKGISDDRRGGNLRHTFAVGDTLYLPKAYDVRTGDERLLREDPVTGDMGEFKLPGKNFCGTIAAGQNLVTYRSASVGFAEVGRDSGSYWLPEVRPSCWISVLPVGGIVLSPEGYSTCICPYNYKTSVALMPVDRNEEWSIYLDAGRKEIRAAAKRRKEKGEPAVSTSDIVKTLRVNFNAPGDRMDSDGDLWMAYPRPLKGSKRYHTKSLPITIEGQDNRFLYNADYHPMEGTSKPWLYTSGAEGPIKLAITLSDREKHTYSVKLMFAETEPVDVGGRVFDVRIQGKRVLSRFDIVREAGGVDIACTRHIDKVAAMGVMTVELVPVNGKPPRISSLAITREN